MITSVIASCYSLFTLMGYRHQVQLRHPISWPINACYCSRYVHACILQNCLDSKHALGCCHHWRQLIVVYPMTVLVTDFLLTHFVSAIHIQVAPLPSLIHDHEYWRCWNPTWTWIPMGVGITMGRMTWTFMDKQMLPRLHHTTWDDNTLAIEIVKNLC